MLDDVDDIKSFDRFAFSKLVNMSEHDLKSSEQRFHLMLTMPRPPALAFQIGQVVQNKSAGIASLRFHSSHVAAPLDMVSSGYTGVIVEFYVDESSTEPVYVCLVSEWGDQCVPIVSFLLV